MFLILQVADCFSDAGREAIRRNFEELRLSMTEVMGMFKTEDTRKKLRKMISDVKSFLRLVLNVCF